MAIYYCILIKEGMKSVREFVNEVSLTTKLRQNFFGRNILRQFVVGCGLPGSHNFHPTIYPTLICHTFLIGKYSTSYTMWGIRSCERFC